MGVYEVAVRFYDVHIVARRYAYDFLDEQREFERLTGYQACDIPSRLLAVHDSMVRTASGADETEFQSIEMEIECAEAVQAQHVRFDNVDNKGMVLSPTGTLDGN